jgi:hypothetical protein
MSTTPKLALNRGGQSIVIEYAPYEIEGVTMQEILNKVKEDTTYFTIDEDTDTGELYLTPGGKGREPLTLTNAEGQNIMLNGAVTIYGDKEDGIIVFASQYSVCGIAPIVEEHPEEESMLQLTVYALYWQH